MSIKKIIMETIGTDWLENYTYDALDTSPSEEIVNELLQSYGNQENTILYRGMNFSSKELYEQFMSTIEDGSITLSSISSWTKSKKTASQFSLTKPSYFVSYDTMKEYSDASKEGEELAGYRGVILTTKVRKGQGIDVDRSPFGYETEIILPKGRYAIKVTPVKKFKEMVDEYNLDSVVKEFYSDETDEDYMNRFAKYIVKRQPEKLRKETIHDFIQKYGQFKIDGSNVHVRDKNFPGEKNRNYYDKIVTITYNHWPYFFMEKGLLSDKDKKDLIRKSKQLLKQLQQLVKKYNDEGIKVKFESFGIERVAEITGQRKEYINILKNTIGRDYNELNSKETIDDINSITDPEEKQQRMKKYLDDIENVFNGFNDL